MDANHSLLENGNLVNSSDDEGMGSDESLNASDPEIRDKKVSLIVLENNPRAPVRSISFKNLAMMFKTSQNQNKSCNSLAIPPNTKMETKRVFGVDLIEHLERTSAVVPDILEFCTETIEGNGVTDGVYRLSGQSSYMETLRRWFEEGEVPDKVEEKDVHSVASLLKLYFRLLPNPLLTFSQYQQFMTIARMSPNQHASILRRTVAKLPKHHLHTLTHLIKHLRKLSLSHQKTGMTSRNLAIVWAPNLLRHSSKDCLKDCGMQAIIIESLIVNFQEIFETDSEDFEMVFTKEVSIDQAVARAESFKPATERKILRSISCSRGLQRLDDSEVERRQVFQGRGVTLKRYRSFDHGNLRNTEFSDIDSDIMYDSKKDEQIQNANTDRLTKSEMLKPTYKENSNDSNDDRSMQSEKDQSIKKIEKIDNKFYIERLGRSRLRENLIFVRDRLRRSRERLSFALRPSIRRSGSYVLTDDAMEADAMEAGGSRHEVEELFPRKEFEGICKIRKQSEQLLLNCKE